MGDTATKNNILGTEKIGKLLLKFAVPSIISGLVGALYNIVDQIFIGQGVGLLGNAATNVAFPLTTICVATALLLGVGSASGYNLEQGAGNKEKAAQIAGCGVGLMVISGVFLAVVVLVFLQPLMILFGATEQVLPYALTYTGITAFGMPFFIFSNGGSNLIRADGSPTFSMVCMLSGAILNTILDPLFIFGFGMGIAGAAWATVIGQVVSALMVLIYILRHHSAQFSIRSFKPSFPVARRISSLGAAACFNQLAMFAVQITMNNVLGYYGGMSRYGAEIPLASVGIITKVNFLFMSVIIGIAQGNQPIVGFNYGAKNYPRVKEAWKKAVLVATVVATAGFLCFQLFPRQIIAFFGTGTEEYFSFAERYFRVFMLGFFLIGIQPVTSNFFTSIGKAKRGILLSLTRQIIFLLPLILIFPMFLGIDGVMYAGPISDTAAAILALILIYREMKSM